MVSGHIYESPIGPVTEIQVVAVDTGHQVKWVQRYGEEILDCREGI